MSEISDHGDAELEMIEVPVGKQSADMHIGFYLGYLAGRNGKNCSVVIVSKDTDFDNVIKFLEKKTGIKAVRVKQIEQKTAGGDLELNHAVKPVLPKRADAAQPKGKTVDAARNKIAVNTEIQRALSRAGFSTEIIAYTASAAAKNLGAQNGKQRTYKAIVSKYGQTEGLMIYNHIKKLL